MIAMLLLGASMLVHATDDNPDHTTIDVPTVGAAPTDLSPSAERPITQGEDDAAVNGPTTVCPTTVCPTTVCPAPESSSNAAWPFCDTGSFSDAAGPSWLHANLQSPSEPVDNSFVWWDTFPDLDNEVELSNIFEAKIKRARELNGDDGGDGDHAGGDGSTSDAPIAPTSTLNPTPTPTPNTPSGSETHPDSESDSDPHPGGGTSGSDDGFPAEYSISNPLGGAGDMGGGDGGGGVLVVGAPTPTLTPTPTPTPTPSGSDSYPDSYSDSDPDLGGAAAGDTGGSSACDHTSATGCPGASHA